MVKVRDRIGTRCEESTCIKQASFAMDGDCYPKFCKDHRQANMINIRDQRCRAAGCSRGASFAATGGERGQFCSEHKGNNMVSTPRRSQCMVPGCTSRELIYVIDGQQLPKFCVGHRGPDCLLLHPTNIGATEGSNILPNVYHPGTTDQLRGPRRRVDGEKISDQEPGSSKHPRRMEHPGPNQAAATRRLLPLQALLLHGQQLRKKWEALTTNGKA
ncbi:EsV-1-7 [Ectocarpus siliculosus]|uniref:EsV-1-7 n=1 Tax=Ectocarpus siliculosus TaxID=2880 RepID=D7G010_ECTSI|nr:EsV-1-7 [Ectocarpus siliculosus]|eukprot:CBJ48635.1 EsV-1-7 [Ectocarpus siliculosus]